MELYLVQKDYTYNITDDDGSEYTVMIMEDINSGSFQYDVIDDDGEEIKDHELTMKILNFIENSRP
jgi:hypothetical protein